MKISNAAPSCGALAVMYAARLGTTKAARMQNALFCQRASPKVERNLDRDRVGARQTSNGFASFFATATFFRRT